MTGKTIKFGDTAAEDENVAELINKIKNEIGKYWKV